MKTIGLLGGTGWSSTIKYYSLLNKAVNKRLGGDHSAQIILSSIDYHDIHRSYGKDHDIVAKLLKIELIKLLALKPDCFIICCNTLHKFYEVIKNELCSNVPIFHAIDLVAQYIHRKNYKKILLLATKFTLNDGFFAEKLESSGIKVEVPNEIEREKIHQVHALLMKNDITQESKKYFHDLIARYVLCDAVILGCTEFSLLINHENSILPIINPVHLQVTSVVNFALD